MVSACQKLPQHLHVSPVWGIPETGAHGKWHWAEELIGAGRWEFYRSSEIISNRTRTLETKQPVAYQEPHLKENGLSPAQKAPAVHSSSARAGDSQVTLPSMPQR